MSEQEPYLDYGHTPNANKLVRNNTLPTHK